MSATSPPAPLASLDIVLDPNPLRGVVLDTTFPGWAHPGPHPVFVPVHVLEALADGDAGIDASEEDVEALTQSGYAVESGGSVIPTPLFLARWNASQDAIYGTTVAA